MNVTITPQGMKALEEAFMAEYALPGALLMEHAAQAVCRSLHHLLPGGRALFLCGPGNNGGDGYAAARLWQAQGGEAVVMELSAHTSGDAAMNRALCRLAGIPLLAASPALPPCQAVVDALFGTGLCRPVEGLAAQMISAVNASGLPVVAVDIPSGLCGETGRVLGTSVRAAETVTFHRVKPGLLLRQGPDYAGRVTAAPILIPKDYGPSEGLGWLDETDLPRLLPSRPRTGHKGTFGRVVIFAGSPGMAGAAAFCAQAAMKAGAGLTTVLCRENIVPLVQALAPGAVCIPLPVEGGKLSSPGADLARTALENADAAAVGCGLGQQEDALPILRLFAAAVCPVVWDADALNLIARQEDFPALPRNAVLTPHPAEAARLLRWSLAQVLKEPTEVLEALQRQFGCLVLLKGARTLMHDGEHAAVNLFGTPALAKGGSGDVLTGMLAAVLGRELPATPLEKVQLAVMLHGMAGMRAEKIHGENCVGPQDLIGCIRMDAAGI